MYVSPQSIPDSYFAASYIPSSFYLTYDLDFLAEIKTNIPHTTVLVKLIRLLVIFPVKVLLKFTIPIQDLTPLYPVIVGSQGIHTILPTNNATPIIPNIKG